MQGCENAAEKKDKVHVGPGQYWNKLIEMGVDNQLLLSFMKAVLDFCLAFWERGGRCMLFLAISALYCAPSAQRSISRARMTGSGWDNALV